jgi:hypothetical protein
MPARIPRYRTSEWEIKEIGFLQKKTLRKNCVNLHAAHVVGFGCFVEAFPSGEGTGLEEGLTQ